MLFGRPVSWKIIAIIGGTIVLVVLVIVGAWWLVSGQNQKAQRAAEIEKVSDALDKSLTTCDKEKNPDKCRADMVEEAATSLGAAQICAKLSGEDLAGCIWQVAKEQTDAKICDLITEKEKQDKCADSVYQDLAEKEKDLSWCEKINSQIVQTRCVNSLSEEIALKDGCSGTGVDPLVCERLNKLNAAVASGDPDQCLSLSASDTINCLDVVGRGDKDHDGLGSPLEIQLGTSDENIDSDSDGLTDYDEYKVYETDPAKPDTDGDSYTDGEEIKSGYNPLGSGKL